MFDYVYEILGMDFDNNNNGDDDDYNNKEEGGGGEASSSSSSAGSNGGGVAGDATERSGGNHDDTASTTSHHHHYQYEEDQFSWSDTRVGSQLIWMYGKLVSLWSRQHSGATFKKEVLSSSSSSSSSSTTSKEDDDNSSSSSSSSSSSALLSKQDMMAREGLFHLEKAAELGHPEAQRMVANSLASGILPLSDHSLMHRLAEWQYLNNINNEKEEGGDASTTKKNWTSILLKSTVQVPDDFSSGGQQLSRAILLWHLSAMDGNVESAMALGYRHLYSATGGSTLSSDLINDNIITAGYHPLNGGTMGGSSGSSSTSHYGVLGTCPTALAYYEAAANGVMDELESGPTKGKVVSFCVCVLRANFSAYI